MAPTLGEWRKTIPVAIAIASLSAGAGLASAGGGGLGVPEAAKISDAVCLRDCAGMRKAIEGSKVELTGRHLGGVEKVSFKSAGGRVRSRVTQAGARRVVAKVPQGARSGRPKTVDAYGATATAPVEIKVVAEEDLPAAGEFKLRAADATPRKAFFSADQRPRVRYVFRGDGQTDVRVDVIERESHAVVDTFTQRDREPFTANVARWDGLAGRKPAPSGRYAFRIGPARGAGAAESTDASRFSLYGNKFPVRGRHSFGDGFGAGRNHQGQDIFARCGTKLVAARAGRVTFRKYHASAGNYLVIDAKGTKLDYMYAHLARRSPLRPGARVKTGQKIGVVGETGNASGCHLHFELWNGPWQQGGEPLASVKRITKRWDSWS